MSSVTEGLGTSLLDAMACGKPVVATTAGGIPEVVVDGETGLLVPPRDPRAMAAAIVRLLADRRCGSGWATPVSRASGSASAPSAWSETRCDGLPTRRACTRTWKRRQPLASGSRKSADGP